jgi:arylsulfatase A-like enzyme
MGPGSAGGGGDSFSTPSSVKLHERALSWLAEHGRRAPFLLMLLAVDPHEPYAPVLASPPGADDLATQADVDSHQRDLAVLHRQGGALARSITRDRLTAARLDADHFARTSRTLYEAEVQYLDRRIGELLDALATAGLDSTTIVSFNSDHGEEFLEHGAMSHGQSLYGELLHVPWIVRYPGQVPAGQVLADPVMNLDLAPTLLGLAGLAPPREMSGRDLSRALTSAAAIEPRPILAEQHGAPGAGQGDAYALIDGRQKMIWHQTPIAGRPAIEIYDLDADLGDRRDVSRSQQALAERARSRIQSLLRDLEAQRARHGASGGATISAADLPNLRALGYLR